MQSLSMSFRFSIVVSRDHIIDSIPYGHVSVGYTICDHTVNGERFTLGFAELNFRCFHGLLAYRDREFLSNKHWWSMHRESISAKNFIGLNPRMFIPANLCPFTV